jgi:PTH1 family peptidyl-tRNA hydrolase
MAWLQKRPQVSDPKMFYSMGLNRSKIIVGLGNPGKEYDYTRHNIGFMCVDEFVKKNSEMSDWTLKKNLKCLESTGRIGETRTIVIKPTTFMNLSGEAVQSVSSFYKIPVGEILVLHDEIDIEYGQIRLRVGGSSAGHNGIKSISNIMGEDYGRTRIGIGPKKPASVKSEDFVLKKFSKAEQEQLPNLLIEVNAIISEYLYGNQLPIDTRSFLV